MYLYLLLQDTVLWDTTRWFCSRIFGIPLPEELPRFQSHQLQAEDFNVPLRRSRRQVDPSKSLTLSWKELMKKTSSHSSMETPGCIFEQCYLIDPRVLWSPLFWPKRSGDQKNRSISPGPHGILIFLSSSCLFHWKHPWFTVFRTFDPLRCCLRPSKKMAFILIGPTLSMCHKGLIDVKLMSMLRTMYASLTTWCVGMINMSLRWVR